MSSITAFLVLWVVDIYVGNFCADLQIESFLESSDFGRADHGLQSDYQSSGKSYERISYMSSGRRVVFSY